MNNLKVTSDIMLKTWRQLANLLGSLLIEYIGEDLPVSGIAFHSDMVKQGDLFVAVSGIRDGHAFIQDALQKGASIVLVSKACPQKMQQFTQIVVSDTVLALGLMAKHWRTQFDIPVIGITGSCGKTTTKDLVTVICEAHGRTVSTYKNYNNHLGVPHTLFQINAETQYAVVEVGTNHLGEIPYLADIVQPSIALVTNVSEAHIEGLKSIDHIFHEKTALLDAIKMPKGVIVLNDDDLRLRHYTSSVGARVLRYGQGHNRQVDVQAYNMALQEDNNLEVCIDGERYLFETPLLGMHNAQNILAAITVGKWLKFDIKQVQKALKYVKVSEGRTQAYSVYHHVLINDTYNAAPASVVAAIQLLSALQGKKKILVLSTMGELGEQSTFLHDQINQVLQKVNVDYIYFVGEKDLVDIYASNLNIPYQYVAETDQLTDLLSRHLGLLDERCHVLLKGARRFQLDKVVKAISEIEMVNE